MGDETPIVVFVNKKSGGQKGEKILAEFQRALSAENVYCLQDGGPEAGLKWCYEQPTKTVSGRPEKARLVVAGGDGTVGWVISGLDKMEIEDKSLTPVAHLPLGTGNDMARSLGWGGGYDGGKPQKVLKWVRESVPETLDRWDLTIKGTNGPVEGEKRNLRFYNYFSVGADAQVAFAFHTLRENRPGLFKNRAMNKLWYAKSGLQVSMGPVPQLSKALRIETEGHSIEYPRWVRTIIGLNIQSYMGGSDIWGTRMGYSPTCCCVHPQSDLPEGSMGDGKIDLVGISGAAKQGAMKSMQCTGVRIDQVREITMISERAMYVQADGEPWKISGPFTLTIQACSSATMLMRKKK